MGRSCGGCQNRRSQTLEETRIATTNEHSRGCVKIVHLAEIETRRCPALARRSSLFWCQSLKDFVMINIPIMCGSAARSLHNNALNLGHIALKFMGKPTLIPLQRSSGYLTRTCRRSISRIIVHRFQRRVSSNRLMND